MTKSGFIEDMILLIRQAESEALKNNIQANTVILNNKKFGKVKPFYTAQGALPPMICGLEINLSNELPEGYDFLIYESPIMERERLISDTRKETARECLKILHGIGGCDATEEWSKGFDAAIDEAYKEISDKYGVTAFDEEDEE